VLRKAVVVIEGEEELGQSPPDTGKPKAKAKAKPKAKSKAKKKQ
jgi:hypothetical protein